MARIRVGIIGASAQGSWGGRAHIPALRSLPEMYEVAGVATTNMVTAQASAEAFSVPRAFGSVHEMAAARDIDLLAVCVKVPNHVEVLEAAAGSGKAIYCEWPLTVSTKQAEWACAMADETGIRTAIGLQGRADPAIRHAKRLISDGLIGEVQSASLIYSSPWPTAVPAAYALMQDSASGLSQLELSAGHSLDAMCWLLGEFESLSALQATHVATARLIDTGESVARTSADQIAVHGTLKSGITFSAHIQGAPGGGTGTRVEIQGTTGSLIFTSTSREAIQSASPSLAHFMKGKSSVVEIPADCILAPAAPAGVVANVANMYAAFANALNSGERFEHDFSAGLQRHRMLDAIRQSSAEGVRITL